MPKAGGTEGVRPVPTHIILTHHFHHWGKWGSETPAYIILTQTDALIPTKQIPLLGRPGVVLHGHGVRLDLTPSLRSDVTPFLMHTFGVGPIPTDIILTL
ncbi:hypothetical protein PROFUN_11572 [Planoprotostelium fungivorum]|uniref:Uncharacterized protein n=1 Tax=Planoprotostelium fungivorum TaxID=1890364 RepID=A0A2P6N9M2_9EUKA|nr:hypothetical protein PROFUN_11572 [Planoprotostelium fungivorum]